MTISEEYSEVFRHLAAYDSGVCSDDMTSAMNAAENYLILDRPHIPRGDLYDSEMLDFSDLEIEIASLENFTQSIHPDFSFQTNTGKPLQEEILSLLKAAETNVSYRHEEPLFADVAAEVFCSAIGSHILVDGNKRLGTLILIWMSQKGKLVRLTDEWYSALAVIAAIYANRRREPTANMVASMLAA